jgi:hypothetical protein
MGEQDQNALLGSDGVNQPSISILDIAQSDLAMC